MGRITAVLIKTCNLRMLVVVAAAWIMVGGALPQWVVRVTEQVNQSFFRVGLYFSELPSPHTPITVVHVSDLEYDRWLVDMPGASRLLELLNLVQGGVTESGEQGVSVLGLVLERPIELIQPEAESLLAEVQQGRTTKQHLYEEVNAVLARRDDLLEKLTSKQVVLGVENLLPSRYRAISVRSDQMKGYPELVLEWLWPTSSLAVTTAATHVLDYFPILSDSRSSQAQFLALKDQNNYAPTFWSQFILASEASLLDSSTEPSISWQRDEGFTFGERLIRASANGAFIPIYGELSGIPAPLRQITLGAALTKNDISGWILIGRDSSGELSQVAQVLASLGDDAVLLEPLWWSPIHKMLFVVLVLFLLLIVPLASSRLVFWGVISISVALVILQIGGHVARGYWLPSGELLIFVLAGYCALFIWRQQQCYHKCLWRRADVVSLQLANHFFESGVLDEAFNVTKACRTSEQVLEVLYKIGLKHEELFDLSQAFAVFKEIRRRKLRYLDVNHKLMIFKSRALLGRGEGEGSDTECAEGTVTGFDQTQALSNLMPAKTAFGRYEIERELGRGASGTVYLANDPLISRKVAIKTLNYHQFSKEEIEDVKARFVREAEAAGSLSHSNIVQVFDVGEEGGAAYIAMDFAKGAPLSDFIHTENLLPVFEVYRIVLAVAEALEYAHSNKIVHRDIKPGNILYSDEPFQVKVTDFGIARFVDHSHTRTGEILGSPLYMAPEQLLGKKVDYSADIFSLGVMFYQLLTGSLPFGGDSLASLTYEIVHNKHKGARAIRKSLPASATRITNVALQKKPSERYSSATAMADALRKAIKRDFFSEAKACGFF